jgi:hypothetical protein
MTKEITNTFVSSDNAIALPVITSGEDVWLNRQQMSILFGRDVKTIGKHIANAIKEELKDIPTVANFATVQNEGGRDVLRNIEYYNLDVIISVGYRVKSKRGIEFRRWANQILKQKIIDLIKSSKDKIKELLPYKEEIERRETIAADYRYDHKKSKLQMINIKTGKSTTLWNLPVDVKAYLLGLSKIQRGLLFDRWKQSHNFNEFVRFRMKKEGFKL